MTTKAPHDLLQAMTRDEKIAQLVAVSVADLLVDGQIDQDRLHAVLGNGIGQISRVAGWSGLSPAAAKALGAELQHFLRTETRCGVPAILHEETNCGLQARGATVFPQAIGVACSWDLPAVTAMHDAIRREARAIDVHLALSPVLDLVRDARWGRCEETFGEDPLLTGRMAMATVQGLQTADLKDGIGATLKHFVGHGSSEGGRNEAPVHMGERELRDVMLVPFEMTVREAAPLAIMNGYHDVDGVPCAGNPQLLTEILRDEWGFEGIVVSDYEAVDQLRRMHFTAADKVEASAQALAAGIDIELPFPDCFAHLGETVERGLIDDAVIDRAVFRVLEAKGRLGLLDGSRPAPADDVALLDSDTQRLASREIAEKTLVLLKNDGVLPLARNGGMVAVIGPAADTTRTMLGDYAFTAAYDLPDGTRPAPGMASALSAALPDRKVRFAKGCDIGSADDAALDEAVALARDSDIAVVVVGGRSGSVPVLRGFDQHGDMSGEGRDRAEIELRPAQRALVQAVAATGTPVVLTVIDGRPLALGDVDGAVSAILYAWLPGTMGGEAIARILTGRSDPCGRLCVSLPRETGQIPVNYARHPASSKWNYIFGPNTPLYPFGHGLTYSQFEYRDLAVTSAAIAADETLEVSFTAANTGSRAAVAVPQLYVRDHFASVVRPVKQLVDFARVALAAGGEQRVFLTVPAHALGFHNRQMQRVVEPGTFTLMIGESSGDIRLQADFAVA